MTQSFIDKAATLAEKILALIIDYGGNVTFEQLNSLVPETKGGIIGFGDGLNNVYYWPDLSAVGAEALCQLCRAKCIKLNPVEKDRYSAGLPALKIPLAKDAFTNNAEPHLLFMEINLPSGVGEFLDISIPDEAIKSSLEFEYLFPIVQALNDKINMAFRDNLFDAYAKDATTFSSWLILKYGLIVILDADGFYDLLAKQEVKQAHLSYVLVQDRVNPKWQEVEYLVKLINAPLAYHRTRWLQDAATTPPQDV